jgi:hypothetical protein
MTARQRGFRCGLPNKCRGDGGSRDEPNARPPRALSQGFDENAASRFAGFPCMLEAIGCHCKPGDDSAVVRRQFSAPLADEGRRCLRGRPLPVQNPGLPAGNSRLKKNGMRLYQIIARTSKFNGLAYKPCYRPPLAPTGFFGELQTGGGPPPTLRHRAAKSPSRPHWPFRLGSKANPKSGLSSPPPPGTPPCGQRWLAAWGRTVISPHAVPALDSEELRQGPGVRSAGCRY